MLLPTYDVRAFPIAPDDNGYKVQDEEFERLLLELINGRFASKSLLKLHMHNMKRLLLTGSPSVWQQARFWFFVAQHELQEDHNQRAFEALLLCLKATPAEATITLAHLHSLLAAVALKQGFPILAMKSSSTTFMTLQKMQLQDVHGPYLDAPASPAE